MKDLKSLQDVFGKSKYRLLQRHKQNSVSLSVVIIQNSVNRQNTAE